MNNNSRITCNIWTSEVEMTNISLKTETIQQLGKLLGVHPPLPSPTSVVAQAQAQLEEDCNSYDAFKSQVNKLASYFLNETIHLAKIHLQFCYSMEYQKVDMLFAIEHFVKRFIRGPALYMALDFNEGQKDDEDDVEWDVEEDYDQDNYDDDNDDNQGEDENEGEEESDNDYGSDMDHELDEYFLTQSDDDDEDYYGDDFFDCPRRPKVFHTPLFNTMYPALTENDNYFKLSHCDFQGYCYEVSQTRRPSCDIPFVNGCEKILKDAMLRFILVESLKR